MTARAAGRWHAGLVVALQAAAAWPIARRLRAGRPLPISAAARIALGSVLDRSPEEGWLSFDHLTFKLQTHPT